MEHPQALAQAGRAGPVVLFAHNRLCALARPGLAVEPTTLLDLMLDPQIKLGTSTPRADPSGDYAWDVFRKADAVSPGAYAKLDAKALQLTGGASSKAPPADRTIYSVLIEQGAADIFLAYCTGARTAQKESPGRQMIALPDALAVGADYGLTVITGASPAAYRFALFILSPQGQRILEWHTFAVPNLPQ
jgi:molybdate transport system substrate-binding protein